MAPMTTEETIRAKFPDLKFTKLTPPTEHPTFNYNGFNPSLTTLHVGHQRAPGRKLFPIDVYYDRDVAVPMRDGIKIYTDVFRPVTSDRAKVPALIPWSPYGKTGTGSQQYDTMGPFRCGLAPNQTSGYEKFEGPDPADWCQRGYAIINADARGAGMSEGNIHFWGQQEAEDVYDTIDWVAKQPWCNGSVGMMGNSWLAVAQVNYASRLKHPACKALAPWEAFINPYVDIVARGGCVARSKFQEAISGGFAGRGEVEGMGRMIMNRPLFDEYWESKNMHVENIDVPLYVLASYSTMLHSRGSFKTFRTAKSKDKWLRVHPYQEWYDLYMSSVNDDLQKYFDRYLKGIDNGWERDTPPVRLSLLGFEGSPARTVINRPEREYPLARQQLKTYYLNASTKELQSERPRNAATASHEGHSLTASSDFTLCFPQATEIAGYCKARLWMSCAEKDDMDVVVNIRKISSTGRLMEHLNYPCPVPVNEVPDVNIAKTLGPQGFLRASHAVSKDEGLSQGGEVVYRHDKREPITPGSIVELEIPLWPIGMVFAAGEGIVLRVAGHDMIHPEFESARLTEPVDANAGTHVIHTGGQYDSCLILPVIPDTGGMKEPTDRLDEFL